MRPSTPKLIGEESHQKRDILDRGDKFQRVTSRDYDNFSDVLKHHSNLKITHEETPFINRIEFFFASISLFEYLISIKNNTFADQIKNNNFLNT